VAASGSITITWAVATMPSPSSMAFARSISSSSGVPERTSPPRIVLRWIIVAMAGMPWPTTSPMTMATVPSARSMTSYQSPPMPSGRDVGR
jgi:hypothetical protein